MNNLQDEQFAVRYAEAMDIYWHLAKMQNIDDIEQYARDWLDLAKRFDEIGARHNAEAARSRGAFYGEQAGGEYVRLIEGSFSELIHV